MNNRQTPHQASIRPSGAPALIREPYTAADLPIDAQGRIYHLDIKPEQIAPDIVLRFLYYVSDLPLAHDATLSARLRAIEGVPPLYAITREILTGIFEQEMTRDE